MLVKGQNDHQLGSIKLKNKFLNINEANNIYSGANSIIKRPVVPLSHIRKKNFKISEMRRTDNEKKVPFQS